MLSIHTFLSFSSLPSQVVLAVLISFCFFSPLEPWRLVLACCLFGVTSGGDDCMKDNYSVVILQPQGFRRLLPNRELKKTDLNSERLNWCISTEYGYDLGMTCLCVMSDTASSVLINMKSSLESGAAHARYFTMFCCVVVDAYPSLKVVAP